MNLLEKAKDFRKEFEAQGATARKLVNIADLGAEDLKEILSIYPEWKAGQAYKVKDQVRYKEKLYEVIQAHTSQRDWAPDKTPALFKEVVPKSPDEKVELIGDFKQPTGAHDSYKKGDKVRYKGKVYESTIDNNAYSPADYPQGWKEVVA